MQLADKNKFKIEKKSCSELSLFYPILFAEVFNASDPDHIPGFVYLISNDNDNIGFVSAYMHNISTIYIQYAGALKKHRGFKIPLLFNHIIAYIHFEYPFILTLIANDNIPALKIALNAGFKIIGSRLATDNTLYVELLSERGK